MDDIFLYKTITQNDISNNFKTSFFLFIGNIRASHWKDYSNNNLFLHVFIKTTESPIILLDQIRFRSINPIKDFNTVAQV